MASLAAAGAWLLANAGTIATVGSLAASGVGYYKQAQATKEATKKTEKLAKAERAAVPEVATELKKVDLAAKARDGMQQQLYAAARKGSTATGGTVLG
jgi:hypothetical protein